MKNKFFVILVIIAISVFALLSCDSETDIYENYESYGEVTVTFNTNGGDTIENISIKKKGDYLLPTPSKKGYSFAGWYIGDSLVENSGVWTGIDDVELVARWNAIEYGIHYMLNTNYTNVNPSKYTVEDEIILKDPSWIITDNNLVHVFDGWYKDAEFLEPLDKISIGTTGEIYVFPKWVVTEIQDVKTETVIKFEADGFDCNGTTQSVTVGEKYSFPALQKDGYVFVGWENKGKSYPATGIWTESTNELILKPSWVKKTYSITYNFNGGSASVGNFPTDYDADTNEFMLGIPKRNGYKFIGWECDGNIEYYCYVNEESNKDLYYTAMWYENKYTFKDSTGIQYLLKEDSTLSITGYDGDVKNIVIPFSYKGYVVNEIGDYAFCGYGDRLQSETNTGFFCCYIPYTVKKVSQGAFEGCNDLKVQMYSENNEIDEQQWINDLNVGQRNEHFEDVILGFRPAIGWKKYWLP